jgi:hypothetical protein
MWYRSDTLLAHRPQHTHFNPAPLVDFYETGRKKGGGEILTYMGKNQEGPLNKLKSLCQPTHGRNECLGNSVIAPRPVLLPDLAQYTVSHP